MQEFSKSESERLSFTGSSTKPDERELIQKRIVIIDQRIKWLMKVKNTLENQLQNLDQINLLNKS
ncbi:MAG: hypothetical protein K9W44_09790 [Candidatus Lokiarchaeota archaeon]|nr:hypothetical protein [Candidatus Harpocratesius repetitus]